MLDLIDSQNSSNLEKYYNDLVHLFGEENQTRISKRGAQRKSLGREWPKIGGKVVVPYVFTERVGKLLDLFK